MKIIVDEMPSEPKDCIFSEYTTCKLWQGRGCEPSRCDFLKPIADYVLEECVAENITKRAPVTDVGNERRSNKKDVSYE